MLVAFFIYVNVLLLHCSQQVVRTDVSKIFLPQETRGCCGSGNKRQG